MMNEKLTQLWDDCLAVIKDNVDIDVFDTWFAPIEPIRYQDNVLTILVPSQFYYEYLEEQYADLLSTTLTRICGKHTKLMYRVLVDQGNKRGGTADMIGLDKHVERKKSGSSNFDSNLNNKLTFDNFVEGECNKLTRTAGINIASQPGKTIFNPLFIYGKSGVGKTHLANAIGLKTKELHPQKRILYVSANLFQLQYTEASRNGQTNDFLNFYQTVDVLIIDDIQEFGEGKKTSTQNTFFHIFNHLHQSGKQLILTCDKKPAELDGLEERLLNRFKWGLSAELEVPDFTTRKAILQQKAEKDGLRLPESIINYIAEHVNDNVRNLEGTIISLIAQSTLNQRVINLDLAKKVVSNLVGTTENKQSIKSIVDTVCKYFGVTTEQMQSASRKREIVQARQIAMFFANKLTEETLTTIGTTIGNRNHATVLHACKTVSDLAETDKQFRRCVEELEEQLHA
ncbi:MAG: chromosomal replication initiator protein DnaA [Paludibacteraceae bacterium]|jgi:chromosomal replication initiator protein|nr:chromosomal replication initiator protein DnaA [Paludibacteraceae bacterium]MEE1174209.1 chromosomal replication initiator protein DnaA [Paludibacteraceae bacterium]